eukprot:Em0003g1434a
MPPALDQVWVQWRLKPKPQMVANNGKRPALTKKPPTSLTMATEVHGVPCPTTVDTTQDLRGLLFGRSVLICECLPSQQKLSGASNIASPDRDERDCPRDGQSQEREAQDQTSSPTSPPIRGGESHQRQQGREDHSPLHVQFNDSKSGSGKEDHAQVPTPLKNGGNLADEDEEAALEEAEVSTGGSITRSSPCYTSTTPSI